jgi:hypothetical protein
VHVGPCREEAAVLRTHRLVTTHDHTAVCILDHDVVGVAGEEAVEVVSGLRDKPCYRRYRNSSVFVYFRNLPFASVPAAIACLLIGFALLVVEEARSLAIALTIAAGVFTLLMLYVGFFPPRWSKPRWVVERERDGAP